jgi:hypothetical protein
MGCRGRLTLSGRSSRAIEWRGFDVKQTLRMASGTSQLGGKRAYQGRLGNDRSPHHSRRSDASA